MLGPQGENRVPAARARRRGSRRRGGQSCSQRSRNPTFASQFSPGSARLQNSRELRGNWGQLRLPLLTWLVPGAEPGWHWPKFGAAAAGRGGHGRGGSTGAGHESLGGSAGPEAARQMPGLRAPGGFD
ncbi:uncharacterized protein LOC123619803 [Camelus bactrianus]|uniref:Uncharacterized protein LOC123619803 n=1 Tax=Camelus bactrianus TaxID=9837 RepID=A0AC58QQX7_CAMBA